MLATHPLNNQRSTASNAGRRGAGLNSDRDTVDQWLPALLRAHGGEITIRELMLDSSGLVDDNDVFASPSAARACLARVGDPRLRAQLLAIAARIRANPAVQVSPLWFIRLAAWQPLVAPPGTAYHHSNIGWNFASFESKLAAKLSKVLSMNASDARAGISPRTLPFPCSSL
jgi:hypothetical protein